MANISSIHICALKTSAMLHNERRKEMSHVRSDLTRLNEKWENPLYEGKSIENIRKDIEEKYYRSVHQRMQKKSVPLREGVVNIRKALPSKIYAIWQKDFSRILVSRPYPSTHTGMRDTRKKANGCPISMPT